MNRLIYNWQRFWCLRDGGFHIDENGFLLRSEYFKDTVEFESIAEIPCLVLLGEPGIGKSRASKDAVQFLVTQAYMHAPDEVIQTILKQIDAEDEKGGIILFPQRLDVCWDDKLKDALRDKLNDDTLTINLWGRIFEELLDHNDAPTQEIAQNVLTSFVSGEAGRERALLVAASLMRHGKGETWWSFVWKAINKDADFGRALVESVCFQTRPSNRLKESEAAEFYLWFVRMFPPSEDPPLPMGGIAYHVTTRMEITDWRNSFLSDLKQRGTPESLVALEKIATESPELEKQLHWILIEARENVRRHTWQPPNPMELLDLLKQKTPDTNLNGITPSVKILLSDEELKELSWRGKSVADVPALLNFLKTYRDRPNDVVFFVGAGLSVPLFPSWKKVLEEMINETVLVRGHSVKKSELKKMLRNGEFLEVADRCAEKLGDMNYRGFIRQQFGEKPSTDKIPEAYLNLLKLNVRTILTTNYDLIPDTVGAHEYTIYKNSNSVEAKTDWQDDRKIILKIHGCVTDQNSIVLTRADYQKVIYQGSALRKTIETIIESSCVLFLGFSFSDPHFDSILGELKVANRGIAQNKYALMEGLSDMEIESKEKGYNLKIIPYKKSADTHPEVLAFIQLLLKVQNRNG